MKAKTRPQYLPSVAARQARVDAIRLYRAEGWTHAEIAQTLGVDRSLVTYYLSPRCKVPIIRLTCAPKSP
jgi:DNA-binding transcriptional regulator LsrR (DeoR family)